MSNIPFNSQRTIQRRKQAFESKSVEIESYLAENDEREKKWLEQQETNIEKSVNPNNHKEQITSPAGSSQSKTSEKLEVQDDKTKPNSGGKLTNNFNV